MAFFHKQNGQNKTAKTPPPPRVFKQQPNLAVCVVLRAVRVPWGEGGSIAPNPSTYSRKTHWGCVRPGFNETMSEGDFRQKTIFWGVSNTRAGRARQRRATDPRMLAVLLYRVERKTLIGSAVTLLTEYEQFLQRTARALANPPLGCPGYPSGQWEPKWNSPKWYFLSSDNCMVLSFWQRFAMKPPRLHCWSFQDL